MANKIKKNKWYILDQTIRTRDRLGRMYHKQFKTKSQALKALRIKGIDDIFHDVVKGRVAIEMGLKLRDLKKLSHRTGETLVYNYPSELEDKQNKKSFRTKYRRWKRDYNRELKNSYAARKRD